MQFQIYRGGVRRRSSGHWAPRIRKLVGPTACYRVQRRCCHVSVSGPLEPGSDSCIAVVLHDGDHGVAEFAELVRLAAVTPSVVCDLLSPPLTVPLWFHVTPRAPVPETTVNEDGDAMIGEDEVGPSWQTPVSRRMTDAHLSHDLPDASLWLCSLRCDATHPLRYLCCRLERTRVSRHAVKGRCCDEPLRVLPAGKPSSPARTQLNAKRPCG